MLFKVVVNNNILGVGEGTAGEEITQEEYDTLTSIFHSMPVKEGYGYRLKTDLTWEQYEKEPEEEPEPTAEEVLDILLGGDTE